jgi:phosphotriesterase-related protein
MGVSRRSFLLTALGALLLSARKEVLQVMTIRGPIPASQLGKALIHEHFLVDFIGADKISSSRWNNNEVSALVLSYLLEAKQAGVKSIFDCTPSFLGRDVSLLQLLAKQSGLQLITNTGYYGAVSNKYLPTWAFTETAEQLAARWIDEYEHGIDGTSVKPGFIKIGVDGDQPLSSVHQKLVQAAALTHLKTGLTICSHTGPAKVAFEELQILDDMDVKAEAFVWVHAQNETDRNNYIKAARAGCWVSLDGIGWGNLDGYVDSIVMLKNEDLLHQVLISHDAGWYKPKEDNKDFKGYTPIFSELMPLLKQKGFTNSDFDLLLIRNPAEAMSIRVRKT